MSFFKTVDMHPYKKHRQTCYVSDFFAPTQFSQAMQSTRVVSTCSLVYSLFFTNYVNIKPTNTSKPNCHQIWSLSTTPPLHVHKDP